MISHQSIQRRIRNYSRMGLITLVILLTLGLMTKAYWQRHQSVEKVEVQLLATTNSQAKRILGTLILPEERAALPMILDRIQRQEKLSAISVHQFGSVQGTLHTDCKPMGKHDFVCSGAFDDEVKTQSVLRHGGKTYGVIEKRKSLPNQAWLNMADPQVWLLILGALGLGATMLLALKFMQKELEQKSIKESLGEMSKQVAHDLRSPLSLLKVVAAQSDHPMTDTEKRLARQAIKRLEQITESLLRQPELSARFDSDKLAQMIEALVAEKSYQHQHLRFIFDNQITDNIKLNSKSDETERALSNLLDNAAEAIESDQGSVRVSLYADRGNALIDILDTGVGLTDTTTSSKKKGNAMGVRSAKRQVQGLNYESISGIGTATRIRLA